MFIPCIASTCLYCVNLSVHSAMFMLGRGVVTQCMITKIM